MVRLKNKLQTTKMVIKSLNCISQLYLFLALMKTNCPKTHFTCDNMKCVRGSVLCDGEDDCGDGSDEVKGCSG